MVHRDTPDKIPDFNPYDNGNKVYGDIRADLASHSEAFDNPVVRNTTNILDIASQYIFSPERVRLFKNGSRSFVQYNSLSHFEDATDVWKLKPAAGDTLHIESSESLTYVVNYVMQPSFAFQINQSLQSGDSVRIGPYNGTDGWVMEQRGSDHADDEVDIIQSEGGVEKTLVSNATLPRPLTDWTRLQVEYNWYNVGNQVWIQTYTDDGRQLNEQFAESSLDGTDRGPDTGNLNLWQEVTAGSGTSNLELIAGSMGGIVLGKPRSITRDKPQFKSELPTSGSNNTWEPFYALRIDPAQTVVNAQFARLALLNYGNNADFECVAASFHPSKTDASGWSVPEYHHSQNSIMQETTSVSQVADTTGTVKDFTSSDKFGGHTVSVSAIAASGGQTESQPDQNENRQQTKAVLSSDELVFLARSPNIGGTVDLVWDVDQDW